MSTNHLLITTGRLLVAAQFETAARFGPEGRGHEFFDAP
jgi:hypothetical protein